MIYGTQTHAMPVWDPDVRLRRLRGMLPLLLRLKKSGDALPDADAADARCDFSGDGERWRGCGDGERFHSRFAS